MAGTRREARPRRRVARTVGSVALAALLLLTMTLAASLLSSAPAPGELLAERLPSPWVEDEREERDPLGDALAAGEPDSLRVAATVVAGPAPDGDGSILTLTVSIVAEDAAHPVVDAVRRGEARRRGAELAAVVGAGVLLAAPVQYADPTVEAASGSATVNLRGVARLPPGADVVLTFDQPECRVVRTRELVVDAGRGSIVSVQTPRREWDRCPAGRWTEQAESTATFEGHGPAVITLAPRGSGLATDAPHRPLVTLGPEWAGAVWRTSHTLLLALPLAISWLVLRRRSWREGSVGRVAAPALGALVAYGLIVGAVWVLSGVWHALIGSYWHTRDELRHLPYPSDVAPVLMIVLLAVIWRRVALRGVHGVRTRTTEPTGATSTADEARWLGAVAVVLALPLGAFVLISQSQAAENPAYSAPVPEPLGQLVAGVPEAARYPTVLVVVCALCIGLAALLAASLRAVPTVVATAAAGAALALVLLALGPVSRPEGVVPSVLGVGIPVAAGAALWLTFDRILRHVLNADPPRGWDAWRPQLRRWRAVRPVVAVGLSIPAVVYGPRPSSALSHYDFMSLASSLAPATPFFTVVVLVLLLRHLARGRADQNPLGTTAELRRLAILLGLVGLLAPTATTAGLPIAFVLGWLLLETFLVPAPEAPAQRPEVSERVRDHTSRLVRQLGRTVLRARTRDAMAKDLRKRISESDPEPRVQDARVNRVVSLGMSSGSRTRAAALSTYGGRSPWRLACELSVLGTVIGLPWSMVNLSAVISTLSHGGQFRVAEAAAGALVVLRFTVAGLVIGAAYPMIRGRTGLGKGVSLAVTLTVPALVITLLPDPGSRQALVAAGLQALQWVTFGVVLGLTADLRTFRRAGLGWRHLRELHHMNAFAAGLSSVLVAAVTATATAAGTGAATFFVERVLVSAPEQHVEPPATQGG